MVNLAIKLDYMTYRRPDSSLAQFVGILKPFK
jgi:hypothetical protein